MGSKRRIAKDILPIILAGRTSEQVYVEPFCLAGDTILFTEDGVKALKDIEVGEYIYNDIGSLVKVVNKQLSSKTEGISIKLKGGITLKATKEHIFYDTEGTEVYGDALKGLTLLTGRSVNATNLTLDMAEVITLSKNPRYGRSGSVQDTTVKITHNSPYTTRFIKVTEKLMYLYGLVCAEGSAKSLTFHKKEEYMAVRFLEDYLSIINAPRQGKCFYSDERSKGLMVTIPYPVIYERLFFDMMGLQHGSRNRNISFLFKVEPSLVLSALRGMYFGDGSCTRRPNGSRALNYKTSSETLAKQLQCLLSIKFGIKSTLTQGINKERLCEGRVLKPSNYFNIGVYLDKDIAFLLGENSGTKLVQEHQQGFVVMELQEITDTFYDITLEDGSSHKYILEGGIVTHNCGGCNVIDKVPQGAGRIANDVHVPLVSLLKALQEGWIPPEVVSEEEYRQAKLLEDTNPLKAFFGFGCSFGSKWFGGMARGFTSNGVARNYAKESKNNLQLQAPSLKGIEFHSGSYKDLILPKASLIYCDPPYKGTTSYKDQFNHEEFYEWCLQKHTEGHTIFVSEYFMPEPFIEVWSKTQTTNLDNNRVAKQAVEKLFTIQ
jgi:DNA adenine methylase